MARSRANNLDGSETGEFRTFVERCSTAPGEDEEWYERKNQWLFFPKLKYNIMSVMSEMFKMFKKSELLHELIFAAKPVYNGSNDKKKVWALEDSIRDVIPFSFRKRRIHLSVLGYLYLPA